MPSTVLQRLPLVLAALLLSACDGQVPIDDEPAAPAPTSKKEPSLKEQLAEVRAGDRKQIRVWDEPVTDKDIESIAAEPSITAIVFNNTTLTDEGVAPLAAMPALETLRLRSAAITDEGLRHLVACKALRHLILVDAPVTDAGILELQNIATLESLYLINTKVTDSGVDALLKQRPTLHVH